MKSMFDENTKALFEAILSLSSVEECEMFFQDICTIKEIQDRTGRYVGCLEELGLAEGWLSEDHVNRIGKELGMTLYGQYLQCL